MVLLKRHGYRGEYAFGLVVGRGGFNVVVALDEAPQWDLRDRNMVAYYYCQLAHLDLRPWYAEQDAMIGGWKFVEGMRPVW